MSVVVVMTTGVVTQVTVRDGTLRLELQLLQSSVQPPDSIVSQPLQANIEVLEKPEDIR